MRASAMHCQTLPMNATLRRLAAQLRAAPPLSLDKMLDDLRVSPDVRNAAGAVLAQMVHEAG